MLQYKRNLGIRSPGPVTFINAERTKRHFFKWRFVSLRWSLASQQIAGDGYLHRAIYRLPQPVCRSLTVASCWVSAILRAGRIFPSSRYITGTFLNSNRRAVLLDH
jgi:hypothetical protein